VRDLLGVGLSFADQRHQVLAQLGGGSLVEAVVDLAGIDSAAALRRSRGRHDPARTVCHPVAGHCDDRPSLNHLRASEVARSGLF
jgi:hypothetical protein